jgi:hypothetical protein
MDLVLKDQTTQIGLLLGSALLGILILKNFEKQLSSNVSNGLVALVVVGTLYLAMEIHNKSQEGFYQDGLGLDEGPGAPFGETTAAIVTQAQAETQAAQAETRVARDETQVARDETQAARDQAAQALDQAAQALDQAAQDRDQLAQVTQATQAANNAANNADMNNAANTTVPDMGAATNTNVTPNQIDQGFGSQSASVENLDSQAIPSGECYPKDILAPEDLFPKDAQSQFAENTPNAPGALGDQNFLNAGFHVGVNTVGQSLRNANRQLRSEPPNPQVKVSPWLQSTIEPDINRRPLEIASAEL